MLSRSCNKLAPRLSLYNVRYFAQTPAAFDAWQERINKLESQYPKLYNESAFKSDQESLLSSYPSNISSLLSNYNGAKQAIDSATGETVFLELNETDLIDALPLKSVPFYQTLQEPNEMSRKLVKAKGYVDHVIDLQNQQENETSLEKSNLLMIQIAKYGEMIDHWMLQIPDGVDDNNDLGLPISDAELDAWVGYQYNHAPDRVREQGLLSYIDHKNVEDEWMRTLDDKLIDLLNEKGTEFDESRFRELLEVTNTMFHPHNIGHYIQSNYAKALFRSAIYESKGRTEQVEQSIKIISDLLHNGVDDEPSIMRALYENNPETRYSNLAALQLQLTDPLYAAKLVNAAKLKLEEYAQQRAIKDILYDLEVPYLQKERIAMENELVETLSTNPANLNRSIANFKKEEESYQIDVPTLESVLDDILPKKLWGNDVSGVRQAIVSYANGGGSLDEIQNEVSKALKSSDYQNDLNGLDDSEILELSVKYHNARYENTDRFHLMDFCKAAQDQKEFAQKLSNQRSLKKRLDVFGVDRLVLNVCRMLVADGQPNQLEKVCADYLDIMKTYRGEIDGQVMSASELSDDVFEQICNAIQSANPEKKITLKRVVDQGIQSGFIVKAGVQRFDFSLATVIHQGRSKAASINA